MQVSGLQKHLDRVIALRSAGAGWEGVIRTSERHKFTLAHGKRMSSLGLFLMGQRWCFLSVVNTELQRLGARHLTLDFP